MTNLEHFKKRINEMSAEKIGEIWQSEEMPWCNSLCIEETCAECVKKWANQPHIDPMPELKVGMMVKVTDEYNGVYWGIIREREGRKIVTYAGDDSGFDFIKDVTIDAIYDAPSFLYAREYEKSIIWRRD